MFDVQELTRDGQRPQTARPNDTWLFRARTGVLLVKTACIIFGLSATSAAVAQVQEAWVARYNGTGNRNDTARAIAVDSSGNVYVTGASVGFNTRVDYLTVKYDTDGVKLWESRFNGPTRNNADLAYALALDSAGNVYVTGHSFGFGTDIDYVTIKYDTNGNQQWVRYYNGPGNGQDLVTAIAVDSTGNVFVTGRSIGSTSNFDYATVKYDTNGSQLWVRRYNGPADGDDFVVGLALDSAGNVSVTGWLRDFGTSKDYATLRYDSDGNLLWERRYDGPFNGDDVASAIAVDAIGNVYVTGWSKSSGTSENYLTLKYGTGGDLLWERRYDGPDGFGGLATALAVDDSGNVYVTGYISVDGPSPDYGTVKYDTNGNQIWDNHYNGLGNNQDFPTAIEVDDGGNAYVTGWSHNSSGYFDYATIKLDASGNQVWVIRYDGQHWQGDLTTGIAVDSTGNVLVTGVSRHEITGSDYLTIKYVQDTTIEPDSFSLFRGVLTGGGLADLLASDDSWMTVLPGITLNQSERQVQLIVTGTSPTETPSELRIRVEAHAEINNIGQWIELWNYDTNSYEQVDFMIATLADSIVEVTITTNPERFIQTGTKQMKAKISYKEAGIVLQFPWLISFDQTVWIIVP